MSYEKTYEAVSPDRGEMKVDPLLQGRGREAPSEPVSEQVRCIEELGNVANGIAHRMFASLFGRSNEESCENARGPECLEDVLKKHRRDMKQLVNLLEEICTRLGV